jgi:hypothetical protein
LTLDFALLTDEQLEFVLRIARVEPHEISPDEYIELAIEHNHRGLFAAEESLLRLAFATGESCYGPTD